MKDANEMGEFVKAVLAADPAITPERLAVVVEAMSNAQAADRGYDRENAAREDDWD